jgi:predicted nuclease of predicted toxin-antitoxin system
VNFLIDNALSPVVAKTLSAAGHDAVHVRERGMHAASDDVLFEWAASENRVLVSVDTDFTRMLSQRYSIKPSLILFRRDWHVPQRQASVILANLFQLESVLDEGSVVIFDRDRIRIRRLPILG